MRLIVLLLLSIVIGVFVWQNLQSVTLIFFGGSMIARLPLSIWIVIFTGAGLLGSLVIQLLSNLFRPSRAKVEPFKPSPAPRSKKPLEPKRQETVFRPSPSDWNSPQSTFREEPDDWDIESPPRETTPIQDYRQERMREKEPVLYSEPPSVPEIPDDPIQDAVPPAQPVRETPQERTSEGESIDYEVPQSPQNVSRTGSIYSYTYRESTKSQQKPTERVYDADFRVIKPPARENADRVERDPKMDDDEEEWI